ncbi:MAG: hypothetical protein QG602_224 [Verrucomicrobiota bacterium]|nr:hypothetical protein [Verrucomicrobiota bacterium]
MTDRPIIFSAPMVRALLDGRKTQTRRVLGNSGPGRGRSNIFSAQIGWSDSYVLDPGNANWRERDTPYAPGDRLWVREAWRFDAEWDDCPPREFDGADAIHYEADGETRLHLWGNPFTPGRLRPPIHMPRWASRLTLIVTDVRVQRVQEISEADAKAEGADDGFRQIVAPGNCPEPRCDGVHYGPLWHFRDIWNSIHGPDAWDANPWVAAISFTVHRCNIDTMEEGTW